MNVNVFSVKDKAGAMPVFLCAMYTCPI